MVKALPSVDDIHDYSKGPVGQWRSQPDIWSCKCKFFCVYRPYKESISKEMNNDNDLNLHCMTKCRAGLATAVGNEINE